MFGRTDTWLLLFGVTALALGGALTDLIWGKIFNWMNLLGVVTGLIAALWVGGLPALASSLLALIAAFFLYGWMFWTGAMGAGDVKFLMALGAWGGLRFVLETGLLGIVLGGILAVFILLRKGRFMGFVRSMQRFLLTVVVKELELEAPKVDHSLTMPFGVPIAIAAILVASGDPMTWLGVPLWSR